MKCIHIPKTKNLILFLILIICSIFLNLPFILMNKLVIEYNLDTLLLIHVFLPVIYAIILCMLFSYFIFSLEAIISTLNNNLQIKVLSFLGIVEICIGIFTILFFVFNHDRQFEDKIKILSKTLYFESIIASKDITSVFHYWTYIYLFSIVVCSVLLFFAVARQSKIKKTIRLSNLENQSKAEINQFLGFDFENCDFYQQVNIPYQSLLQTDGTRGEFEVYHMLIKNGFTNAKYIFNREIPKSDGLNTELDLIIIHEKGIFVVENKHYTTRIYGNALDHDLTIIDHSGNKKSIYNPIKQNENHVVALKEFLKLKDLYINDEKTPVYSIVVFTAEGNDKTDDIISGITTVGTETKVCTSQNVYHIINQLISSSNSTTNINVSKINDILLNLPIRKKYS